ncbi:MAG TPA: HAMP domain-containing sensor histidine kinase [Candidatus Eisenbacteria bacterium]|nr:HAMP domain-containing sensor histidine kinase [Candidatus Eisenbacteria bacterium]
MQVKKIAILITPYLLSLISTAVSSLVAYGIFMWLGKPIVFTIFLPAIMISAWYGGAVSGLLTNILSALIIYYFFTIPYFAFNIKAPSSMVNLVFFIFEGLIVSYFIDSGHRHEKIKEYRERERESKKIIEYLQKELQEAHKETALRDEFLAIASHELKTPLTTVVLQIQTTLHNIRNVSLSEFSVEHLLRMLQSMQNQTKRLSKMINDLLNISLITTHKMELELEEVELGTLIHDVVGGFLEKFEKEGTHINLSIKDTIFGKWDKLRLEQVLDNLISNALKYGNKEPVDVALEKQDGFAVIRVIDHGIGIKGADKNDIFTLFKRGSTEKEFKGLGIGLYIAQQIILLHGGTIQVKSNVHEGSTFTIRLPITEK